MLSSGVPSRGSEWPFRSGWPRSLESLGWLEWLGWQKWLAWHGGFGAMSALSILLTVQLITTLFLVGLIWTIQVISYPLFGAVPAEGASHYHAEHMRRITPLVMPPMFLELACAGLLLFLDPGILSFLGAALLLVVWVSTALLQVPAHGKLSRDFDPIVVDHLVRSNWIRTIAWTVRGGVVVVMFLVG